MKVGGKVGGREGGREGREGRRDKRGSVAFNQFPGVCHIFTEGLYNMAMCSTELGYLHVDI